MKFITHTKNTTHNRNKLGIHHSHEVTQQVLRWFCCPYGVSQTLVNVVWIRYIDVIVSALDVVLPRVSEIPASRLTVCFCCFKLYHTDSQLGFIRWLKTDTHDEVKCACFEALLFVTWAPLGSPPENFAHIVRASRFRIILICKLWVLRVSCVTSSPHWLFFSRRIRFVFYEYVLKTSRLYRFFVLWKATEEMNEWMNVMMFNVIFWEIRDSKTSSRSLHQKLTKWAEIQNV